MSDEDMHLFNLPTGLSVDLFAALGSFVSAALGGCGEAVLAPDDDWRGSSNTGRVLLRTELDQAQVAAALRAATEQLDPEATAKAASTRPRADPDESVETGHMRAHDDGSVSFGIGGVAAEEATKQLAGRLASLMLPLMDTMGAGNYLAWDFVDVERGGKWELTITKPRGLTPHQARNRCQDALRWIAGATRDRRRTKGELVGAAQRALDEVKATDA